MLTHKLFKTQSMLLSATCRKGQPDADLHPVQIPEHTLVRSKQERLSRCWLTFYSKSRLHSCQQKAGRSSQMLTYTLLNTQNMLLSATSREGLPDADLQTVQNITTSLSAVSRKIQWDADLHPVQNPEHASIRNKHKGPVRWWLTPCSTPRACSCQQKARRAIQMLTNTLFNGQSMLLSAISREGLPDADLHPVQNTEHALVSIE